MLAMLLSRVVLLLAGTNAVSAFLPMPAAVAPSVGRISTVPHTRSLTKASGLLMGQADTVTASTVDKRKTLARKWALNEGFYQPATQQDLLAEDYVFRGPIIGPLNKADVLGTVGTFKVYEAFPDIRVDVTEFTQDTVNPNRFWGLMRVEGTHTEDLVLGGFAVKATGKTLDIGPELISLTFNDEDKIVHSTGGYVGDMHEGRKAGGLGLVFGILKCIDAPAPRPGGKLFKLSNWIGNRIKNFPKSKSHVDDLPDAWKHQGRTYGLRSSEAWE